jgi:hypothetical protein
LAKPNTAGKGFLWRSVGHLLTERPFHKPFGTAGTGRKKFFKQRHHLSRIFPA